MFLLSSSILNNPNENGIIIFVLGILFIISLYHFLLFFQIKKKVYLFYSIYSFLIFISYLDVVENGFIPILIKPIIGTLNYLSTNLVWTYNIFYFIFLFTFIDIKPYSLKWYRFIKFNVIFLFILCFIFELLYVITGNLNFITNGNIIFTILITLFSLSIYIPLFKVDNSLKYYAIAGSLSLFICSIIATIIYLFELTPEENEIRLSIFYFGVILENIFFSLGLGKKQKLVILENVELQKNIYKQKENELLLENEKAEKEKLKATYDKELAENQLYALRSQMNPHFVFNSLTAIQYYISSNNVKASENYLIKFSKLIRQFFELSKESEINIEQEIKLISNYLDIEKLRFEDKFTYEINVDSQIETSEIKLPTMLIQPIVENAIVHGIFNKLDNGEVTINFKHDSLDSLKVEIIDNGVGFINTEVKNNNKRMKSSNVLSDRLRFFNKSGIWNIKYSQHELTPDLKDKGNITTFIIKKLYDNL
ncbi:7TM protein involved in diverse intracellular signaling [Lutibacter sp. Hel_I_33_5]|uniref:sensor histidine kinase n=1 Tax=Lutibacter sp. Hel_I_33_5 TaxID=1566289 RepID=UPI00119CAAE9|nr:histidine kinase [Lutibacter sp. Hel_I_33_5]TVZ54770.1 7TM protein involved in diverse intracellular signaling [Lutibacter sp. Hel_I_33_5]